MSLEKLINEIASKTKNHSPYCAYQLTLDSMTEKDRKALDAAWEKNISANIVVKALRASGYKATAESIRAHRRGMCRCPKS